MEKIKQLLLVDDENLTTLSLTKMVERSAEPFHVAGTASNGAEALEFLEEHEVDIVIADIQMPIMDGVALLNALKERNIPANIIVLSAYRDFEYAQQAINSGACSYLLKPVSQNKLMEALHEASKNIEREQLLDVAQEVLFRNEQQRAIRRLIEKGERLEGLPPEFCSGERFGLLFLSCAVELPLPYVEDCMNLGWYPYRDSQMVHLMTEQMDLTAIANEARRNTAQYFLPDIIISASGGGYSILKLHKAFAECKVAAMYYFYLSASPIIHYSDVKHFGGIPIKSIVAEFEKMDELILISDKESILKQLNELYHSLKESMSANPQTIYQLFYELLRYLYNTAKAKSSVEPNSAYLTALTMEKLMGFSTLDVLFCYIEMQFHDYFNNYSTTEIVNDDKIVEKTKEFCRNNFAADCSLEEIAANVYISKSYLSQLFKDKTGMSIWNYFTDIRIENAKELLATGKARAVTVGEMVGYKNPSHFGRIFKARVGLSPREYQQKVL